MSSSSSSSNTFMLSLGFFFFLFVRIDKILIIIFYFGCYCFNELIHYWLASMTSLAFSLFSQYILIIILKANLQLITREKKMKKKKKKERNYLFKLSDEAIDVPRRSK